MLHNLTVERLLNVEDRSTGLFITEAELIETPSQIKVSIPPEARVAIDPPGRWELSKPENRLWRWSAGGALTLLRLRDCLVAVVSVSDAHLPKWASHLTAATGFAPSAEEWTKPLRLMREAFRSLAIATPTGLLVPSFESPELDALAFGTVPSVLNRIKQEDALPPVYHMELFNIVGATLLPLRGEKEITVSVDNTECAQTRALPVLDPDTRGIDLMHAFEIDLRVCTLDDISVFHVKEADGRAKNAEVCLLELDKDYKPLRAARSYRSGGVVAGQADVSKMSPVLRDTFRAL
ncbi:MAG: hypothetical protein AAB919_00200 [Patescibacteria group bacterium]